MTISCPQCKRTLKTYRARSGHASNCVSKTEKRIKRRSERQMVKERVAFSPLQPRLCASDSEDTMEALNLHEDWDYDFIELHEPLISGLNDSVTVNEVHETSHLYLIYQLRISERYDSENLTAPFEVRRARIRGVGRTMS